MACCSTTSSCAGYDPIAILDKYPGRFCSLHLADWPSAAKKSIPVGQGVIDWKQLFAKAKPGGVYNYFVEMNLEALQGRPSLHFARKIRITDKTKI